MMQITTKTIHGETQSNGNFVASVTSQCISVVKTLTRKFNNRGVKYLSTLIGSLIVSLAQAQDFTINKVELTGESIILHYSLIDTTKSRTYSINVYTSRDNFIAPLQKVKGDVGLEVRPGQNKKIIWSSREELGATFQGDVEIEIRGRVYIPFIKFDGFQDGQVIKRGKPKSITWSGGTRQNILNFTLYKGEKNIDVIPNVANSGSYDLTLPTSVKPGSGYYFIVSDSKNKDQMMKTNEFKVKRKVPLLLKLLPVAIIGVLIPTLSGGSDSGPENLGDPPGAPDAKN